MVLLAIGVIRPERVCARKSCGYASRDFNSNYESHRTQHVGEPWSADAVTRYEAQGRPVFVDFTAKLVPEAAR